MGPDPKKTISFGVDKSICRGLKDSFTYPSFTFK